MDINKELDHLIKIIASVTDAFTAAFFVVNTSSTQLKMVASHSLSKNLLPNAVVPVEDSFLGVIYKYGKTYDISKVDRDLSRFPYYSQTEDIKSFLGIPVSNRGILIIDSKRQFGFNDRDKKILNMFAEQMGRAIYNYQRFMYMDEKAGYFDILYAFSKILGEGYDLNLILIKAIRLLCDTLRIEHGFLAVVDEKQTSYTITFSTEKSFYEQVHPNVPIGDGLIGWVVQNTRPLLLGNIKHSSNATCVYSRNEDCQLQSFLGYPILQAGKAVMVLALASPEEEFFSPTDQATLQFIANYATITREYINLKQKFNETDPFTKLYNEKYFRRIYETLAKKDGTVQVAYIEMLRVDKLVKKYGYSTIEKLLRKFASWLEEISYFGMVVAAFKPGQFAVVIPADCPEQDQQRYLLSLREHVEKEIIEVDGKDFPVTFRMALVTGNSSVSAEEVIGHAQGRIVSLERTASSERTREPQREKEGNQ
ncbi:sensor domain-containing diguanylate cyclase [Chrysiogenes arsenatis]|uniref:sensor domain-containing diguanylate cyclase n=1 Tax=Chrysiogenes arsenatis TaxID=309797 RepID=UPI0003FD8108|nr:GAF domain-containing protein [Chrysiogenes arsenatis]